MTDQTTIASPGTAPLSTDLDPNAVPQTSGGGTRASDLAQDPPEKGTKPESVRDTLEGLRRDAKAEASPKDDAAAKPAAKAEADDKEQPKDDKPKGDEDADKPARQRADDGKFAKASADEAEQGAADKPAAGREGDEPRQSEGRKHADPPARFLPEARTKWANVPNEVKAEVHRVSQEYETELTEARTYREGLAEFDELARNSGTDLKTAVTNYVAADRLLHQDFGRGVLQLAQHAGKQPVAAIGDILRAAGVTPEQYAQHVLSNPQAHQPAPAPQQPAPRQPDPEVIQLRQQVQTMQQQMAAATVMPALEQFAAAHPDFHALEAQIAAILRSGVVDQVFGAGLTPQQRLAEAYRMAGGTPPSRSEAVDPAPVAKARPETLDAGTKSVRGAPNGGDDPDFDRPAKSTREMLREEMRRMARN